jgi:hypothetical protein
METEKTILTIDKLSEAIKANKAKFLTKLKVLKAQSTNKEIASVISIK